MELEKRTGNDIYVVSDYHQDDDENIYYDINKVNIDDLVGVRPKDPEKGPITLTLTSIDIENKMFTGTYSDADGKEKTLEFHEDNIFTLTLED
jgi:hypothetical protein